MQSDRIRESFTELTQNDTRCSRKKMFLEISRNSQVNSSARASFLIKLQTSPFLQSTSERLHRNLWNME